MIIQFDLFNDENYDTISINVTHKNVRNIINIIKDKFNIYQNNVSIYQQNNLLKNNFNKWIPTQNYIIMIDNNKFINITIYHNNKYIKLPQINLNTQINELKNILSIKDDIFYKNEKLNDTDYLYKYDFLNDYNILLTTHSHAVALVPVV